MPKTVERDSVGAEFVVESGVGCIVKLELGDGKRNAQIEIKDDNPDLRYPFKGWLDTQQAELWDFARQARQSNARVSYQIETHRDRDVHPSVPIAEVEPIKKFRRLVALSPAAVGQHPPASAPAPQQARPAPQRAEYGDPGPTEPEDYRASYPEYAPDPVSTGNGQPTSGMFTIEEFDSERRRLSSLLSDANLLLRQSAATYADAERTYRKAKAQSWLKSPRSEVRGEWTAAEREAWVNADTADLRFKRDLADGERQAALELIRSLRAELSSLQSELNAHREEAGLARVGGDT